MCLDSVLYIQSHSLMKGKQWRKGGFYGTAFYLKNPTHPGNRPRDLIGLEEQQKKPHRPNTQGRARRERGGEQGHPVEAEGHPEEAGGGRERMEGPKIAKALRGQRGGDQRSLRPETTGRESASN